MVFGAVLHSTATKVAALAAFMVTFAVVEKVLALHRQRIVRRCWLTDCIYFVVNSVFASAGTIVAIALIGYWVRDALPLAIRYRVAHQPLGVQVVEAFVLSDLGEYFADRAMHTYGWLWRFHKVHHSVDEMDWLASARLHPVDRALTASSAFLPVFIVGFSNPAVYVSALFTAALAIGVHANVRLTFGPLRYVIATPQYHHWHHTASDTEGYDKNFAVALPLIDMVFRTQHVPKGQWPSSYGIDEPYPRSYLGQLWWPFADTIRAAWAAPRRSCAAARLRCRTAAPNRPRDVEPLLPTRVTGADAQSYAGSFSRVRSEGVEPPTF